MKNKTDNNVYMDSSRESTYNRNYTGSYKIFIYSDDMHDSSVLQSLSDHTLTPYLSPVLPWIMNFRRTRFCTNEIQPSDLFSSNLKQVQCVNVEYVNIAVEIRLLCNSALILRKFKKHWMYMKIRLGWG